MRLLSLALLLPILASAAALPAPDADDLEIRDDVVLDRRFDAAFEHEERDLVDVDERDLFDVDNEKRELYATELDARDFEFEERDFELDERDFELDERDFELDERDAFELDERDAFELEERDAEDHGHMLVARGALPGAMVTAKSNANLIRSLQWLLNARKQKTATDGSYGAGTKSAVVAFQKASKLPGDGVAGPNTLGALVSTVKSGSTGDFAKAAQAALNAYGANINVDGQFGAKSKAAAVSFQKSKGLNADGIVGDNTWTKLFGGSGGGTKPPPPPPATGNCDKVTGPVPIGQTVHIAGTDIRMHKCFEGQTKAMLAAAKKAGHKLDGWGWRDHQQQIELRKKHCNGNIWTTPASKCNPPTAIPGKSMHERGLAIDFKSMKRTDKEFKWLQANAHKFHFKNLPSEPWHWSWNGH